MTLDRAGDSKNPDGERAGHVLCGVKSSAVNFPVMGKATTWSPSELGATNPELTADVAYIDAPWKDSSDVAYSKYNPNPGSGTVGYHQIPPNNYPFFEEKEKYVPIIQADGGILSDWKPMYNPTPEQAEKDRRIAYDSGIPHGFVKKGEKYKGHKTIKLLVRSELHTDVEYGVLVDENGRHSGGPFYVEVSSAMRIEDLRKVIRDASGIMPGIMRLAYAGKNMEDSQRTLEHYGIAFWNRKFPEWPLTIRRF